MKKRYNIDVYDAFLMVSNDNKNLMDETPEHNMPFCRMGVLNKKWCIVIYLPNPCLRTACHESVHGAVGLMEKLGIPITADNQESIAWLTDYIFSKCQDFIARLPSE